MTFWVVILLLIIVFAGGSAAYTATRFSRFGFVRRISGGRRFRGFLIGLLILAAVFVPLYFIIGYMNTAVILLHLAIFFLLCEFAAFIVKIIRKKPAKRYYAGVCAILITVAYFAAGAYFAFGVWEKDYAVSSEKLGCSLRVAMFADSHVGATFDGDGFARHLAEIQKTQPDLLIIAGDFVDDDTTHEDMVKCCEALGRFESRYGVFYASGNHDRGYFRYRDFGAADLEEKLLENGVTILSDEAVLVDELFYVIGRRDKSESTFGSGRAEIGELTSGLDPSKYMIVIDHQPADYDAEAQSGVDLVLSGHTHGGQLLGLDLIMSLMHMNDMLYGIRHTDGTDFIVTSGISDWELIFKTGCRSEFVVVDVN